MGGRSPGTEAAVVAESLVKTFKGGVKALDGVDFEIPAGTVLGLLGPNGAGKTTAVRILTTLLRPDAGRARVAGRRRRRRAGEVRARHRPRRAVRRGRRDAHRPREPRAWSAGSTTSPGDGRAARATSCSSSSRSPTPATGRSRPTRAACAAGSTSRRAWSHRPPVLFLDEPTTGPRPAQPQRPVGRASTSSSRERHHGAADHAVPRGGRSARRRHRASSTTAA